MSTLRQVARWWRGGRILEVVRRDGDAARAVSKSDQVTMVKRGKEFLKRLEERAEVSDGIRSGTHRASFVAARERMEVSRTTFASMTRFGVRGPRFLSASGSLPGQLQ